MIDRLAQPFGITMQVIVSGCLAVGFLSLSYFAAKRQRWAFGVGMVAYAIDWALMVAASEYLGAVFHALMLYGIYCGFAALGQSSNSKPPEFA